MSLRTPPIPSTPPQATPTCQEGPHPGCEAPGRKEHWVSRGSEPFPTAACLGPDPSPHPPPPPAEVAPPRSPARPACFLCGFWLWLFPADGVPWPRGPWSAWLTHFPAPSRLRLGP